MDVQRLPPYDLADHDLSNENTLLLGAPCIGQTRQLDAHPGITVVETLEAAPGVPDDVLLCIDDFYDAYQSADDASRERLPNLLDRPGGVSLSTRPRALDWLLSEGGLGRLERR